MIKWITLTWALTPARVIYKDLYKLLSSVGYTEEMQQDGFAKLCETENSLYHSEEQTGHEVCLDKQARIVKNTRVNQTVWISWGVFKNWAPPAHPLQ